MCTPPVQAGKQDCGAKVERGQGGLEGSCAAEGGPLLRVGLHGEREAKGSAPAPMLQLGQGLRVMAPLPPCTWWERGRVSVPILSRGGTDRAGSAGSSRDGGGRWAARPTLESRLKALAPVPAQLPSSPPCPLSSTFAPQSCESAACLPACPGGVHIPAPGPGWEGSVLTASGSSGRAETAGMVR